MNQGRRAANWSNMALGMSFVLGMFSHHVIHRGASSSKNVLTSYMRQFEIAEAKKGLVNKRTKLNNGQKQVATKCKGDKEEFDINILFMN